MGHQIASWRTAKGQTAWLSALIEAMARLSRPEWRARPVDRLELALLRARLGRPAALAAYRLRANDRVKFER
jgi:hypothetical protein